MPRKRVPLALPEPGKNGKTNNQTKRATLYPAEIKRRIAQVDQREAENKRLAAFAVSIRIRVPLGRKEAYLDLAERHHEELSTVVRACIEYGFAHYNRFAPVDDGPSPFAAGYIHNASQMARGDHPGSVPNRRFDPVGLGYPGPMNGFVQPVAPRPEHGPLRETWETEQDQVFSVPRSMKAFLPSAPPAAEPITAPPEEPVGVPPEEPGPAVDSGGAAEPSFAFGAGEESSGEG